ncbi:disintegrin and metalloproteinase domain-containing protein 17 [Plakobranchus ocellatus]|uniref:Disintegrin and metalloproteinase domain-containing protein 17 n=1 Tax=Plakobranchus ocellatus TaxID=259542 RepID=A0AAV3Y3G8_9GAST|nr:disintegrin and metalloproteinase domain-containing protein 17 [Plakobranchus ocellatus]
MHSFFLLIILNKIHFFHPNVSQTLYYHITYFQKSFTSFSLPHKAVWAKIRKARYSRGNWSALCGNGRLDRNESCDPGILGANDPCCTETCMLRSHAYCSPFHHPCCTQNCKIAPASKRCNHSMDEKNVCVVSDNFCSGVDATVCPYNRKDSTNAEEFSACGENRVCISGKCVACCAEEHLRPSASQRNTEICSCTMLSLSKYTGRKKVVCKSCCEKTQYYPDVCKAVTTMGVEGEACVFANCSVVGCFVALHRSTLDFDYIKEHNVEDISPKGKENNWGLSVMESIFRALYIILSAAMLIMFLAFVIIITTPYILKRNATHTIENNARPEPVPPEEMRLRSVRLQPKLRSLV